MKFPEFKYHPDPIATGYVIESDAKCECCEQGRGFIYTGAVYSEEELDDALCPWCIGDGSASEKFDATFTDEDGIGTDGESVSDEVIEEVSRRTPGFSGWQQERWWTHCGDAAAFIGRAGHDELLAMGPDAISVVQESTGLPDGKVWNGFFRALDKDGSPTAYLFRCIHCQKLGGYQDCD